MNVSIDDAYKALTTISKICTESKGSAGCKSCPFQTCDICGIIEQGYPAYWSIKKPKIELFD